MMHKLAVERLCTYRFRATGPTDTHATNAPAATINHPNP